MKTKGCPIVPATARWVGVRTISLALALLPVLESELFNTLGTQLSGMGHKVKSVDGSSMGGVQSILFTADPAASDGKSHLGGIYRGGSDHRQDGAAVGWGPAAPGNTTM